MMKKRSEGTEQAFIQIFGDANIAKHIKQFRQHTVYEQGSRSRPFSMNE